MPSARIDPTAAVAVLLLALNGFGAFAHTPQATGTLRGSVVDASNAPLQGVTVTATCEAAQAARSVVTWSTGDFELATLPLGHCVVTFALAGYGSQKKELDVAAQAGEPLRVMLTRGAVAPEGASGFTVRPGKGVPVVVNMSGAASRPIMVMVDDTMRFLPDTITASRGERVKVVLRHIGKTPGPATAHDFVLLGLEVDPAGFLSSAGEGEVIAKTEVVSSGEATEVDFLAPAKPGRYTFLCTQPDHFAKGMKGTLVVK